MHRFPPSATGHRHWGQKSFFLYLEALDRGRETRNSPVNTFGFRVCGPKKTPKTGRPRLGRLRLARHPRRRLGLCAGAGFGGRRGRRRRRRRRRGGLCLLKGDLSAGPMPAAGFRGLKQEAGGALPFKPLGSRAPVALQLPGLLGRGQQTNPALPLAITTMMPRENTPNATNSCCQAQTPLLHKPSSTALQSLSLTPNGTAAADALP